MCVWGGPKGVSNEKFEPCSKSSEVTLLEMTQLLAGNTAFSIMEATWRKGFALLPTQISTPFGGREIGRAGISLDLPVNWTIDSAIVKSPPFIYYLELERNEDVSIPTIYAPLLVPTSSN